jgi:hypothetical protein
LNRCRNDTSISSSGSEDCGSLTKRKVIRVRNQHSLTQDNGRFGRLINGLDRAND